MNMPDKDQRPHWLYRPENRSKLWCGFAVILAATVLAQIYVSVHEHFTVDGWFGFYAVYGFLTCAAMVIFAKLLGFLLKRSEDYYDND